MNRNEESSLPGIASMPSISRHDERCHLSESRPAPSRKAHNAPGPPAACSHKCHPKSAEDNLIRWCFANSKFTSFYCRQNRCQRLGSYNSSLAGPSQPSRVTDRRRLADGIISESTATQLFSDVPRRQLSAGGACPVDSDAAAAPLERAVPPARVCRGLVAWRISDPSNSRFKRHLLTDSDAPRR